MAYDAATGTIVLFGGFVSSPNTVLSDTWSWNGTTWTQLTPATSPPARWKASMDYDAATGTVVLFGGQNNVSLASPVLLGDTWSWDGTTWTQLDPATSPPVRRGADMAYDPATGTMVLFGGEQVIATAPLVLGESNDTWSWDGTTWTEVYYVPYGNLSGRLGPTMAYNPASGTIILVGGTGPTGALSDTWSWNGTTWTQLSPGGSPPSGNGATMDFDPATGSLLYLQPGMDTLGNVVTNAWSYGIPPAVTGVSPASGQVGDSIVISGTNLLGATSVMFGTAPAVITTDTATSITVNAPSATGQVNVVVTTDNGTSATSASDLFTFGAPPAITSAASTTFVEGNAGSFTVTTTGMPAATITESGALPNGVTFTAGALSGTPVVGSAGVYPISFIASNGVGGPATQSFTLTVDAAPAITSGSNATFTAGVTGTFTVTSTGYPTAAITESGALPSGVTLVDNGDGTATLAGTAACGTAGTYPLALTADNGADPAATQTLTLTVSQPAVAKPSFTSAASATATAGTPFSFTVSTSCNPIPALTTAAKDGITLTDNHDGTATLAGTPINGGILIFVITAKNTAGSAKQSFTLTVDAAASFTGGATANETTGTPFSYTIKTKGYPAPAISDSVTPALPSGVTLVDNGNGTATLSGTAPIGSYGPFSIALSATNGVGAPATKTITLKLNEAPTITSGDSVTVQRGAAMTPFALTASGYPAPTITASGLPTGLIVKTVGSQRAIGGTPAKTDALGDYTVTITAKNSKGFATQTLTLTLTT